MLRASTDNTLDDLERAVDDGVNAYKVNPATLLYVLLPSQQQMLPHACIRFSPTIIACWTLSTCGTSLSAAATGV